MTSAADSLEIGGVSNWALPKSGPRTSKKLNQTLLQGRVKQHARHFFIVFENTAKDALQGAFRAKQVPFTLAVKAASLRVIGLEAKIVGDPAVEFGSKTAFQRGSFNEAWGMELAGKATRAVGDKPACAEPNIELQGEGPFVSGGSQTMIGALKALMELHP